MTNEELAGKGSTTALPAASCPLWRRSGTIVRLSAHAARYLIDVPA
jgi:hypothetical protein